MAKFISSKHIENVSDLTLTAPIKSGFIDAFESVTYETRLKMVMKALFKIRSTAREHSKVKPFVDTAERILSLLDFRLAILDTEPRQLLLSATFDRPLEPYMRLIWDPLGPLLDVIFCNCEGYVTATEHGFPDYLAWVRKSQVDSNFFYAASGHSIDDIRYLTKIERLQREAGDDRPSAVKVVVDDLKKEAKKVREAVQTRIESNQMGMQALVALYRLTDVYPPDQPDGDGKYLRWATQQLLDDWGRDQLDEDGWSEVVQEQLKWLEADPMPAKMGSARRLDFHDTDIQAGILENYKDVQTGAMVLMRIRDDVKARKFLGEIEIERQLGKGADETTAQEREARTREHWERYATEDERRKAEVTRTRREQDDIYLNLAFTHNGLVNIGVPPTDLNRLPQEFREGMDERAGLLGDVRDSHPRRWKLPKRYGTGAGAMRRVELSEVDIVIQLRSTAASKTFEIERGHPLYERVEELANHPDSGLELLAAEPMQRASLEGKEDHFGFRDGISQPIPMDDPPETEKDKVARGEIFLGYANGCGDSPQPPSAILDNGTFLVVRKLRQHVAELESFVDKACAIQRFTKGEDRQPYRLDREELYGKLMGRRRNGSVMHPDCAPDDGKFNQFDYTRDLDGKFCPFQAHIRRTNPRTDPGDNNGRPTPRILRRGLSYGPRKDQGPPDAERGVYFMAYNASIAEQYEVIQRWVSGGNPTGVASWQSDPLMGVAQDGDKRTFQFQYRPEGRAECETVAINMPQPFVTLEWGAYLFVPSMAAIQAISSLSPVEAKEYARAAETEEARRGEEIIARLLAQAEQGLEGRIAAAAGWKTCLEDFGAKDPAETARGPAVWAAIRACHGGVIRVPYGIVGDGEAPRDAVLVASKDLVMRVFSDKDRHYSMSGQMARMKQSFGPIFLGLDDGPEYKADAEINNFIMEVSEFETFAVAYAAATLWLEEALALFCQLYGPPDQKPELGRYGELDLRRDFITPVLAAVCNHWFGIPNSLRIPAHPSSGINRPEPEQTVDRCPFNHVDPGGWSWDPVRKPRCPGDFLATSRYCFYPDPVPRVQAYGKAQGQALRSAVRDHFIATPAPRAKLAAHMMTMDAYNKDMDKFARTLIGVMTGFLPPADASLRWALYEWLEEKTFWRIQHDVVGAAVDEAEKSRMARKLAEKAGGAGAAALARAVATAGSAGAAALDKAVATAASAINPYLRARAGLAEPLKRAMQKRPAPDMLWRTATRRHRLGGVEVEDGDRIFIGIVSAMAEDANAGVTDVYPVFGGKREAGEGAYPRHACPAYQFAMGTMMGMLTALMDKVRVEALPAPLLVKVSDLKTCKQHQKVREAQAQPGTLPSPQVHAEPVEHEPVK